MTFKDLFSGHSAQYAKYRPRYPQALFAYLAGAAPAADTAWDCATGNGQSAVSLAGYFKKVIATDASQEQIVSAVPHQNVEYSVSPAERSQIPEHSIDLTTVSQALHWFDCDGFYTEIKRVSKPGAVLAAWAYGLMRIEPKIDAIVLKLYRDIVGPYWPEERQLIEHKYQDIDFPFEKLDSPGFEMEAEWNLKQLSGYLKTWSAVQQYIDDKKNDPVEIMAGELRRAWGDFANVKTVSWPLSLLVGKVA